MTNCEKLRGAVNELRAVDIRMRERTSRRASIISGINTDMRGTWGTETSKYPEEKKVNKRLP